jgi:hypothetical protein
MFRAISWLRPRLSTPVKVGAYLRIAVRRRHRIPPNSAPWSWIARPWASPRSRGRSSGMRAPTQAPPRLHREQGRHAEARDFLATVYRWFTEDFGAPDLKDAEALVDCTEMVSAASASNASRGGDGGTGVRSAAARSGSVMNRVTSFLSGRLPRLDRSPENGRCRHLSMPMAPPAQVPVGWIAGVRSARGMVEVRQRRHRKSCQSDVPTVKSTGTDPLATRRTAPCSAEPRPPSGAGTNRSRLLRIRRPRWRFI